MCCGILFLFKAHLGPNGEMTMKISLKKSSALLVALTLISGTGTAVAADTIESATARAVAHETFQVQMSAYIAASRAIRDTHRATTLNALQTFQTALKVATTDEQLKAAKVALKATQAASSLTAKTALAALVKPIAPVKPVKVAKPVAPAPTA